MSDRTDYRQILLHDPCSYCGDPAEVTDHIEPRALGGPDDWWNLTAACYRCNSRKGAFPLLAACMDEYVGSRRFLGWAYRVNRLWTWTMDAVAMGWASPSLAASQGYISWEEAHRLGWRP